MRDMAYSMGLVTGALWSLPATTALFVVAMYRRSKGASVAEAMKAGTRAANRLLGYGSRIVLEELGDKLKFTITHGTESTTLVL